jgi:hypothetical protein
MQNKAKRAQLDVCLLVFCKKIHSNLSLGVLQKKIQIFPTIIKIKINAEDTGQMNRYW